MTWACRFCLSSRGGVAALALPSSSALLEEIATAFGLTMTAINVTH